jgi:alpha-tubulin suppressor-like RCC1 family protein
MGSLDTHMSNLPFIAFTSSMNSLGVADVSSGNDHTCVMFLSGTMTCWGKNDHGQLGLNLASGAIVGDAASELVNVLVPIVFKAAVNTVQVAQIAAAQASTCGTCFCI